MLSAPESPHKARVVRYINEVSLKFKFKFNFYFFFFLIAAQLWVKGPGTVFFEIYM